MPSMWVLQKYLTLKKSNKNRTSTSLLWGSSCLFLLQREADTSGCRVGSSMVCVGPDHAAPATAEDGRPGTWGCCGCPAPASGLPGPLLAPACTCCCPGLCGRALCSSEWMLRSVSQTGSLTHVARKSRIHCVPFTLPRLWGPSIWIRCVRRAHVPLRNLTALFIRFRSSSSRTSVCS